MSLEFSVKDLGSLHYFLGVEVIPHSKGLFLSQRKYILELLEREKLVEPKPVQTPMASSTMLSLYHGDPILNISEYRSVVGGLQYLALTRPDVSFTVNKVSQFMHQPTIEHWTAVKRILRYLKNTLDFGLCIRHSPSVSLSAFSDSDWAGCIDDR